MSLLMKLMRKLIKMISPKKQRHKIDSGSSSKIKVGETKPPDPNSAEDFEDRDAVNVIKTVKVHKLWLIRRDQFILKIKNMSLLAKN